MLFSDQNGIINAHIDWMDKKRALDAAKVAFKGEDKTARKQYRNFVHGIRATYPPTDGILLDYGLEPRKPHKPRKRKGQPNKPTG